MALFGTDGIRGRFGESPFTAGEIRRIGFAIGKVMSRQQPSSRAKTSGRVLVGRDPRASGPEILENLADGLKEAGLQCLDLGVISTPGVAYCVRNLGATCGIVISASHNPAEDNGLKVFGPDGFKVSDELESGIEIQFASASTVPANRGEITDISGHLEAYLEHLIAAGRRHGEEQPLRGRTLVVDAAHGAASALARPVFEALGAKVIETASSPNGHNINDGCGALHPEALSERVRTEVADAGICFDGDADRLIVLDENGDILDGDTLIAIIAMRLHAAGKLANATVVTTVMSNLGLEIALREAGIKLLRTPVGDRQVVAKMLQSNAILGGEQSGHIILLTRGSTTGDGIFSAVMLLTSVFGKGSKEKLSDFASLLPKIPQILINVPVRDKPPFEKIDGLANAITAAKAALGDEGRVVLRYSGTEGIARVMLEGRSKAVIDEHSALIADVFRRELGLG